MLAGAAEALAARQADLQAKMLRTQIKEIRHGAMLAPDCLARKLIPCGRIPLPMRPFALQYHAQCPQWRWRANPALMAAA
jgi:hypothetical protein